MKPTIRHIGITDVIFGEQVIVTEPVNLYGCRIGDEVFIGPFVEIQQGVVIGHRSRIQSHTFICEGVMIGSECFIGHGVMFINDTFSDGGPFERLNRKTSGPFQPTLIGNGVSIGSNATILPVTICDGAVIGAGAVVTHDITEKGFYAGNPARLLRKKK